MGHPRTFRFGAQWSTPPAGTSWPELAKRMEGLGYDSLLLPDHFGDQLAPVPAMMSAADATTSLKVGALVHCNDFKHPVVLAKELATLDLLSDGRLEWGMGAGWMNSDYEQSGIPHDRAGVRIERMEEAITVMKGLFGEGPVDFAGTHYALAGLEGTPKPQQRPWPKLLIGGGGRKVLTIAVREADIVGINPAIPTGNVDAAAAASATADATDEKVALVKELAGERFADLELNALVLATVVTDDAQGTAEMMAPLFSTTPADVLQSPHVLIGDVGRIADALVERRERWGLLLRGRAGRGLRCHRRGRRQAGRHLTPGTADDPPPWPAPRTRETATNEWPDGTAARSRSPSRAPARSSACSARPRRPRRCRCCRPAGAARGPVARWWCWWPMAPTWRHGRPPRSRRTPDSRCCWSRART
jgi:probable F420-dependent oxidoreductase